MIKLQQIGSNVNVIESGAYTFLFSYETAVAGISPNIGYWRSKDYMPKVGTSKTTERHINKWLDGETAKVVSQDDVNIMLAGR